MDNFEINLVTYFNMLWRRRWGFVLVVILSIVGSIAFALMQPRLYTSSTSLMMLSKQGGDGGAMLDNVFGGSGLIPGLGGGGGMSTTDKLKALLKSRAFNKIMIEKLDLMPKIFKDKWDPVTKTWKVEKPEQIPSISDGILKMQGWVHLEPDSASGLLVLSVDFWDPETARDLTNLYAEALQEFYNQNNVTLSKRERLSYGEQLERNKRQLLEVSKELSYFFSTLPTNNRSASFDVPLQIDKMPLQLGSVLQNGRPDDVQSALNLNPNTGSHVVKNVPVHIYLDYLSNYQKILFSMQGMLHNQYEVAKIKETKDDLVYQVIDKAELEPIPIRPNRKFIVVASVIASVVATTILIFIVEYFGKLRSQWRQLHLNQNQDQPVRIGRVS